MATAAADLAPQTATPSKGFQIALWVVQVLLIAAFGMAGVMKLTTPIADLIGKMQMNWVAHTPEAMVRFIGASELLGSLGLLLPSVTRIKPWLSALAAAALVLVMVMAAGFHLYLGEADKMVPSIVLGALSAFVAWGRFKKAPIQPR